MKERRGGVVIRIGMVEEEKKEEVKEVENIRPPRLNKFGRPRGSNRPVGLAIKYPITWKVVYDQMILHYLQGRTYKEIGELVGYSEIQVGNVIRSPQGEKALQEISKRLKEIQVDTVTKPAEKVENLKEKVLDKMTNFIENVGIEELHPIGYIDRVIRIAGVVNGNGKGVTSVINNTQNTQNIENKTLIISTDAIDKLTKALEASNRLSLPTKDRVENGK